MSSEASDDDEEGSYDGLEPLAREVYGGHDDDDSDSGRAEEPAMPSDQAKITLDDLLEGVPDDVAASMRKVHPKLSQTLQPPIPLRAKAREDRAAAFALTGEELEKWRETVHAIKDSQVLRFPLNEQRPAKPSIAAMAQPPRQRNELESQIAGLLKRDKEEREDTGEISLELPEMSRAAQHQAARLKLLAVREKRAAKMAREKRSSPAPAAILGHAGTEQPLPSQAGPSSRPKQADSPVQRRTKAPTPTPAPAPAPMPEPMIAMPSYPTQVLPARQQDLISQAFATDNVVADFEEEKRREMEEDAPLEEDLTLPGWGTWGGKGVRTRDRRRTHTKLKPGIDVSKRKDFELSHVIISEKRQKRASEKYTLKDVPHPFESREQYEQAMRMPVGGEWNTRDTLQKMTTPRVMKQVGKVIGYMDRPMS